MNPVVVGMLIVVVTLCGCTPGGDGAQRVIGTVKLGADLPLSGDDAPDGLPVKNAIELAIKQAGLTCGAATHQEACVRLEAVIEDDVSQGIHDAAKGAQNVRRLAADDRVIGMVGPLYESLAKSELPVANAAQLAMVSPATTDECLTQEPSDGHCGGLQARLRPGGGNTFFRVVTTQLNEGAAAADLAFRTLGKRQSFVLNDQSPFGQAVARAFADRFARDGGSVVDPSDLGAFDPGQPPGFGSLVDRARASGADVVYFAGSAILAAASLRREMAARMPQVPLIGTDRLANSQFAKSAGASARGCYYTVVGPYPPRIHEATSVSRAYRQAYGVDIASASLAAFDATNVLIEAVRRAIDDAGGKLPSRLDVLREVQKTKNYAGAMGVMSFDSHGDTSLKLVTAYQWMAATEPRGQVAAQLTVN
jgi:branched-chain amino acid transport system substrate-binding protein